MTDLDKFKALNRLFSTMPMGSPGVVLDKARAILSAQSDPEPAEEPKPRKAVGGHDRIEKGGKDRKSD